MQQPVPLIRRPLLVILPRDFSCSDLLCRWLIAVEGASCCPLYYFPVIEQTAPTNVDHMILWRSSLPLATIATCTSTEKFLPTIPSVRSTCNSHLLVSNTYTLGNATVPTQPRPIIIATADFFTELPKHAGMLTEGTVGEVNATM